MDSREIAAEPVIPSDDSNLQGHWKFNTGSGTSATDSSSNSITGTLTNMESGDWNETVPSGTGQNPYSLLFDGSDEYVTMGDNANLDFGDTDDFSISAFFKRSSATTDDTIIAKRNGQASSDTGYILYIDDSSDKLVFELSDGTDEYSITSTTTFTDTDWHHVAVVFDQDSASNSTIYVDGASDEDSSTGTIGNVGSVANSDAFRVAAESDAGQPFDGYLDDVRVYNEAINKYEVNLLAGNAPGGVADDMKLWLDADDSSTLHTDTACTSGTPADDADILCWEDKSGENNHVTQISGDCDETTAGTQTCGDPQYRLNEFNSKPTLEFIRSETDAMRYDLNGNSKEWTGTNLTIFIVFEQQGTPAEYYSFFSNGNPAGADHFQIDNDASGNFRVNGIAGSAVNFEAYDNTLKLYAITADSSEATTYVDGEAQNTSSGSSGRTFEHYRINQNRQGNHTNNSKISEIVVYDRVLSTCELAAVNQALGDKWGKNFGGGTPGGVGCASITNWYDASKDVTTSGSDVTDWNDQGPNDNHLAQSTSGERPTLVSSSLNSNPVIRFDGTDDNLDFSSNSNLPTGTNARMYFVVAKPDDTDSSVLVYGTDSAGQRVNLNIASDQVTAAVNGHRYGVGSGSTDARLITYQLAASSNSDAWQIRINGTDQTESTQTGSAQTVNTGTTDAEIGASPFNSDQFDGDLAEIVTYSTELSSTNRQRVESYLAIKYGLTLDSGMDYIDSVSNVVYPSTGSHSSYTNDIAAIGRDDNQSLDQTTSQSSNSDAIVQMSGASSQDDGDFLAWGNDNGATTESSSNVPSGVTQRLSRVWRVEELNDIGTVTVKMNLTGLTVSGSEAKDFKLVVDSDTAFSAGATTYSAASYSSNIVTFNSVDFSDNNYFILGTDIPAPGASSGNMIFWVKGNAGTSTTTDGAALSSWSDQSGNSNDASQGTSANQPTYESDDATAINGNPVIQFDGSNDVLTTSLDIGEDQYSDLTIFSVYNPDVNNSGGPWGNDDGGWDRFIIDVSGVQDAISTGPGGTPANNSTGVTNLFSASTPSLTTIQWDEDASSGSFVEVFGKNELTFTAGNGPQTDSNFGVGWDGDDNNFDGALAEIVIYSALKTSDIGKIESYFALKYGITLDQSTATSYTNSSGTEVFDADGNHDSYDNDIAGLIQDDGSDLDQTTSNSINSDSIVRMSSASSQNDGDSLVWGNDNGATTETSSNLPTGVGKRLTRIWRVDETGDIGTVTVSFNLTGLTITGTTASDFTLIVDSDTTFSSGATTYTAASYSSNIATFNTVDFADNNYFALGTADGSAPGGVVTDLNFWVKGNDGVTPGSGTVTAWTDQTGTNTLTVNGDPQTGSDTLNSNNLIDLDGTDDYFDGDTDIDMRHMFAVFDVESGSDVFFGPANEVSGSTQGYFFRDISSNVYIGDTDPTYLKTTSSTPSGYMLLHSEKKGGATATDSRIAFDGEDQGVALHSGSGGIGQHTSTPRIGYSSDPLVTTEFDGKVGEIVVYGGSGLTGPNIQKIESYLALKYGITLGDDNDGDSTTLEAPNGDSVHEGDYVLSSGTVAWDASAMSTYHNDIAGIVQDDNSVLDQTTSESINSDSIVEISGASSQDDGDALIWGNDNGATTETTSQVPSGFFKRLTRVWRVEETGDVGTVTVKMDLTGLTVTGNEVGHFVLIVDSDTTFSSGATTYSAASYSSNVLTFNSVNFSDGNYFTLGTMRVAPGGVLADLQLWLKADTGVTGGASVSAWSDQSGHSRDFAQGTSGNRPAETADAMNYNPGISFDGTDDFMEDADGESYIEGEGAMSAFVAVNADSAAHDGFIFVTSSDATLTEAPWSLRFDDAGAESSRDDTLKTGINTTGTDELYEADDDNLTKATDLVAGVEWSSGNAPTFYVEGRSVSSYSSPAQSGTLTDADFVRLGDDGNQEYWDGYIGEIIMYDNTISSSDRDKIHSYLSIKYGTTLDQSTATSYVDSDGTEIFDADGNHNSYDNDIAGIGRDDASGLGQVKSQSVNSDAIALIEAESEGTNASPSYVDITDKEFLIWGNDNGATTETTSNVPDGVSKRLTRIWRVDETGDVGTLTVKMDVTGLSVTGTTADDFKLIIDSDTTFSSGATLVTADSFSSNIATFTNVSISDNDYFALGTENFVPALTFSISDNSIGFGDLNSSGARYATGDATGTGTASSAHTLSASTNAPSGYSITILGDTLTSGSNTITAIGGTNAASSPGSEQFGLRLSASGGSGTATSPYNHASNFAYDATSSSSDQVASSSGTSATTTFSVYYLANIAGSTEAGSYSSIFTYSATGNF